MTIPAPLRELLAGLADGLIPGADGMPAPGELGIAGAQLDLVLASRPDLEPALRRALEQAPEAGDALEWIESLRIADPDAYDALVVAIVGGYYLHPEVQRRLGYPGQTPRPLPAAGLPDYVEEGLLERIYERGPIYRPTPGR